MPKILLRARAGLLRLARARPLSSTVQTHYDSQSGRHIKIPGQEMRVTVRLPGAMADDSGADDLMQWLEALSDPGGTTSVYFESADDADSAGGAEGMPLDQIAQPILDRLSAHHVGLVGGASAAGPGNAASMGAQATAVVPLDVRLNAVGGARIVSHCHSTTHHSPPTTPLKWYRPTHQPTHRPGRAWRQQHY